MKCCSHFQLLFPLAFFFGEIPFPFFLARFPVVVLSVYGGERAGFGASCALRPASVLRPVSWPASGCPTKLPNQAWYPYPLFYTWSAAAMSTVKILIVGPEKVPICRDPTPTSVATCTRPRTHTQEGHHLPSPPATHFVGPRPV